VLDPASRALSAYQRDEARSDINFVWRSICDTRAPQERVPVAGPRLAELRAQPRGLRGLGFNRVGIRCARMSDRIGEHHARPADSAGLSCLRRHTPELATHRRLMPVVADDLIPAPVGNDPYERGHRRLVQPPGSAEAGWQLCERVVDS
jgi:hypothetical protein